MSRAAIDRYLLPAGSQQQSLLLWPMLRQTDRQTDARQMHRPRYAHYAGSANENRFRPTSKLDAMSEA